MDNEKKHLKPETVRLKQKKFVAAADIALDKIKREIDKPKNHRKESLELIKEEIEKMKEALSTIVFQPTYPLYVVDNWHPRDELGDSLLKLYYQYLFLF